MLQSGTAKEIIAELGISPRRFRHLREQGFIRPIAPRRRFGYGRGTAPFEYDVPQTIATIHRLEELLRQLKTKEECRWRLWCEDHRVRIAPDLADTLSRFHSGAKAIKNLGDIETQLVPRIETALERALNHASSRPLAVFLRRLDKGEMRSLVTICAALVLGIRLPFFDEPDPVQFRVVKRFFDFPQKWQLPPGLSEVLPHLHAQLCNALLTASHDELERAKAVCRWLSAVLDYPEEWRRGTIEVDGVPLSWKAINATALLWRSMRAVAVAVAILFMRIFGNDAGAHFAEITSGTAIRFPPKIIGPTLQDFLSGLPQTAES